MFTLSKVLRQSASLNGQQNISGLNFQRLRAFQHQYISNTLNKHFHNERMNITVKTYEMKSGMYVTYLKNNYKTVENVRPLVIVGDPILTSNSVLYPPTISKLLSKYSRIYLIDLPGVGLNDERELVEHYVPFRESLPRIDINFRKRLNPFTGKAKRVAPFHDNVYLDKIDNIREFYFDEAFDDFITEHRFMKIDMAALSMSAYFVVKFFENHKKSIVDKLFIVGANTMRINHLILDRHKPEDDSTPPSKIDFEDKEFHIRGGRSCNIPKIKRETLVAFDKFDVTSPRNVQEITDFLKFNMLFFQKQNYADFEVLSHVAYNLFLNKFIPYDGIANSYQRLNRFININSVKVLHAKDLSFKGGRNNEEVISNEMSYDLHKHGVMFVDERLAKMIIGEQFNEIRLY